MIKAVFYFDDGSVTVHSENTKEVGTKINPGYYLVTPTDRGINIECIEFNEIHEPFPNQRSSEVIDAVTKFMKSDNKVACNEMGFLYKLNILMYGKQGVGKTALLHYISHVLVQAHKAIVFRIDNRNVLDVSWGLAEEIRKIQDNPIIFIMDEVDQYCGKNTESYMKNLLDGNRSIDNSIVLAATNYPDRIPSTLKERPSRFRIVSELQAINDKETIEKLIKQITGKSSRDLFSDEAITEIVKSSKDITIDEIKTIIIDKVMDLTLEMPENEKVGFKTKKDKSELMGEIKDKLHEFWYGSDKESIPVPDDAYIKKQKPYNHTSSKDVPNIEKRGAIVDWDEPMSEGGY
jgi:SpoVK/Ycf46/Vps4 family AAA+-type ATPase